MNAVIPAPQPPRPVVFPVFLERTLSCGLRVIAAVPRAERSALRVPLVAARLAFDGGAGDDPPEAAGTAAMAAAVARMGAGPRTASELARDLDVLGARVDCAAGYDTTTAAAGTSSATFPAALALLSDVVRLPAFVPDEIERARVRGRNELRLAFGSASSLARLVLSPAAYGRGRYGRPLAGTFASLERIGRPLLAEFAARTFRPNGATFVVAGEIEPDDAFTLAERTFGDWVPGEREATHTAASPFARGRAVIIDRPGDARTAVLVTVEAPSRTSPDHDAATLATAVLSGYSGRLNTEIRVRRGLSYGAGANYVARRESGVLAASTLVDNARVLETLDVIAETLASLGTDGPSEAELRTRTTSILGSYYRSIETADGVASQAAELAAAGLPLDTLETYPRRIMHMVPATIRDVAAPWSLAASVVVLAGDARAFADGLGSRFRNVHVIPATSLDLDAPGLRAG